MNHRRFVQFRRFTLMGMLLAFLTLINVEFAAAQKKDPPNETVLKKLAGTIYGRTGEIRKLLLKEGGGTDDSEAAVVRGLKWLLRVQSPDGSWRMDGPFKNNARTNNNIAGTSFGLLPMLGAGYTHLSKGKDAVYAKAIGRGLKYLLVKQSPRTGKFGSTMYSHALATIAVCEAYGLTKAKILQRPAQAAVNYIITAQHQEGGWRYQPRQKGDTSVTGFQVKALKTAQVAKLTVPLLTLRKAAIFLTAMQDQQSFGYGYTGPQSRYSTTAIGLLARQYLQEWDATNPQMMKPVEKFLFENTPKKARNCYYELYATQVVRHLGGKHWEKWNVEMLDDLLKSQDTSKTLENGSWSPRTDRYSNTGGRLMITSFSLLQLQVYYRHIPLYYKTRIRQ